MISDESVLLGDGYLIEPVPKPVRLSAGPDMAAVPTPDQTIYASAQPFPDAEFEYIGVQSFRGYQILTLKLRPVSYVPATGELRYSPHLRVVVETVQTGRVAPLYRGLLSDQAEVRAKVDNPQVARTYAATSTRGPRSYDLLIITTPTLAPVFAPLKSYHDAHGMPTELHTTTDIGSVNPDDVRDYISAAYASDGITYVLIGGDDDVIPAKDLYVSSLSGEIEYAMPGDIYYACLDGTYNYDGDARWGEPTDGPGGGDVDMVAEVYVGRAAVGDTIEAARFVNKTIWYLEGNHAYPNKVLLVGEYLGFGGVSDYAANTLEELIDGASTHGYTTVGIPSAEYDFDELFERDMSWSQATLASRINGSVHTLNHLGHGDVSYAMKFYNSDVLSDLTNEDLCFVYSQTCLAGHFDGADCWAEAMNIKTDYGAFAVIMNARYGWGEWDSTDGPSQRFNREFWDAVYAESMPQLSRANQDSKEDNLYRINESCMRWCTYELNLFGDPTVPITGVTPSGLRVDPADGFYAEGQAGGPFAPDSVDYTLENLSDAALTYEATATQSWVTIVNGTGVIPIGGTAIVTVSINSNADAMPNGSYQDTVSFVNLTDHDGDTTRPVTLKVGVPTMQHAWTLDADPGWSMEGEWAFGAPSGQGGGSYGFADPSGGASGTNVFGVNLDGDYSLTTGGPYHLTLGPIDLTDMSEVSLRFQRWLNCDYQPYVSFMVEVSNGGDWETVWSNGSSVVTENSWSAQAYDIAAIADDQPAVSVRWSYTINNYAYAYSGWNIDDVEIWAMAGGGQSYPPGDLNCDGVLNNGDIDPFVMAVTDAAGYAATYPACDLMLADCNNDGLVNNGDIDDFILALGG